MKLKQRTSDFRVLEVLKDALPTGEGGGHRVYRVTKTKLTTIEAADIMAKEAGVDKREVQFAGLKDRQGVTVQYISIEGGRRIKINEPGLKVEHVFDSKTAIESDWVRGNAFDITVRDLNLEDIRCFREALDEVREIGVPNYFDDQRFGSLRHGQGFVVREMIEGDLESALKRCLLNPSPFDPPQEAAFKGRLRRAWGEWEQCVKLCRGGKHISVFEHLVRHPKDFAGAFRYVSQRIRLIHLYTYQSYLWNESVSEYLRSKLPPKNRVDLRTDAGTVIGYKSVDPSQRADLLTRTIPLLAPDARLAQADVRAAVQRVLDREKLTLDRLFIKGVEGFAFKAEDRPLAVMPRHLRVMKPEDDEFAEGLFKMRLRFELPRGCYATMVIKRLFVTREPEAPPAPFRRLRDDERPIRKGAPEPERGRASTLRESGEIPLSIRRELKFQPKPKEEHYSSPEERDADGKLTFRPKPKDGEGPPAFERPFRTGPPPRRGFDRRPPRGGPSRDGPRRPRPGPR
ncbi:MAG: tRNA pseudouridine(13) synthase TruD [Planctomycetes bacterium]|nr:tRNA pseudouridine(13) synthase TruD [Planctomycetota bacterium]